MSTYSAYDPCYPAPYVPKSISLVDLFQAAVHHNHDNVMQHQVSISHTAFHQLVDALVVKAESYVESEKQND